MIAKPIALILPLAAALAACQGADDTPQPAPPGNIGGEPAGETPIAGPATVPEAPRDGASPALNESEPAAVECGADRLGEYVNVLPSDDIRDRIAEAVGHDRIRYIAPGQPVTADLRPDRLNVETGVDGRIKLFRCG